MRVASWDKVARASLIVSLCVHGAGGVFLTIFSASLFGITLDSLATASWNHLLRPPIIVSLVCIWLPLPIGIAWAITLSEARRYRWSTLVSLLTPLAALVLLLLGMTIVLLPLGR